MINVSIQNNILFLHNPSLSLSSFIMQAYNEEGGKGKRERKGKDIIMEKRERERERETGKNTACSMQGS